MTLCTERIRTLDDIRAFLDGNVAADITPHDRKAAYAFVERAPVRFRYHVGLSRAGKGLVREFLAKVTGYSDAQLTRLIAQQRRTGHIRDHRLRPPSRPFATVCTTADALLLAEVDEALGQLSGPATKRALWRMYHVFGDKRFERLAEISNGHIYNLRGRRAYRNARTTFRTTRAAPSPIGQRRRPRLEGRPGFVRVDIVHSGDRDGEKGAYVINMVDEVTQYQQLASVPRITEHYMVPVLEALVGAFPFRVLAFHADNGSEYINHRVAAMLNKLHIEEFTKSRPRRSNDNVLVESKNGNVVRRWLGAQPHPGASGPAGQRLPARLPLPLPQPPPGLPVRHRGRGGGRTPPPEVPPGAGHDPVREAQIAARRRWLPKAGDHLCPARRRCACRDRPGGCPGSPAGPKGTSSGSLPRR